MNRIISNKSQTYTLGNPVGLLCDNFFRHGNMLHMMEVKKHPLGSRSMLTVLKQMFNSFDVAQIGDLWTLS